MYFDFYTYFKIIGLVLSDKPSPKRLAIHLGLLVFLTGLAAFNAVFLLLDPVFFPRLRSLDSEDPVFIVGNARSGTTLFHRLLCGDRERFAFFRMWELLFPSLIQKKLILLGYATLEKRFPKTHQRLVAWEARQLQTLKQQHYVGIATVEEDEWIFLTSFSSAMLTAFFPYVHELQHLAHFDQRPATTRRRITDFYRGCVKRQLMCYGEGLTPLSKNPAFVSKMADLANDFPDSKFVYLVRNPLETIPSLLKLLQTVAEGMGVASAQTEAAKRAMVEGCIGDYYYALDVMKGLPPERYAIVQYTDLVADPKATIEAVYERLQLPLSPEFEQYLAAERSRQKRYRSANAYSLEEFGIDEKELKQKLEPLTERFGFRIFDGPDEGAREML
jgi:hypothetical protein